MRKIFIIFTVLIISIAASALDYKQLEEIDKKALESWVKGHDGKTMIVMWAPYCPHCLRELETIKANYEFFKKNNVQIIGLSPSGMNKWAARTIKERGFEHKFFSGSNSFLASLKKIDAIPYTIVYDSNMKVLDSEFGAQQIEDFKIMILD